MPAKVTDVALLLGGGPPYYVASFKTMGRSAYGNKRGEISFNEL